MTILEQFAADVAERIREADKDAADASAAFVAGRFEEYWAKRAEAIAKRIEEAGNAAIADAANS